MTASTELLVDAVGRVREAVHGAVGGAPAGLLHARLDPGANTVAWLAWHLTRVQDDHVADAAGHEQVWTADGWADRFALPLDRRSTGYGHSAEEVAAVRVPSADLLLGYHDAVSERTVAYLRTLADDDLARVVDEDRDPPVTLGVRLVSLVSDDLQHAGQAALLRGLLERGAPHRPAGSGS